MHFVTFHTWSRSPDSAHSKANLCVNYEQLIGLMFESTLIFHRDASLTLLTDSFSQFNKIPSNIEVLRFDIDGKEMMLERGMAQCNYVMNRLDRSPIVFLDSDILLNGSLDNIFEHDFDVALTWRRNEKMPINGGVLIINNVRPTSSKRFFNKYIETYREKYSDSASWYGDQLALMDIVDLKPNEYESNKVVDVDGCKVLLLSCEVFNYSPDNSYKEISSNLDGKVILHFKGPRKRLMLHYWKAWSMPRRCFSPLVWLCAWRERLWLRMQAKKSAKL